MAVLDASPDKTVAERDDVVTIRAPEGTLSLELMPLRENLARGFLRLSPRNFQLSDDSVKKFSQELSGRPYQSIIVQDSRKKVLQKHLARAGWRIERAIPDSLTAKCSMVSTYDLPLDDDLMDAGGNKPDIANTSDMHGISIPVSGRKAWAFYTDDGETARVVSEGERKQGMLVAANTEDMFQAADCLVRFLVTAKKSWVVFSVDMGRFVRQFNPIVMVRMVCDRPTPFQHSAVPVSSSNKRALARLFSEYYDETLFQSILRLRKFRANPNYSLSVVDGGFLITKLEGDTGLIYDIYVTPSRQGEGLGRELMKCALTYFAGRVSSVYLHTSYPRAKRLYEKFGFKAVYSQLGIRLDEVALSPTRAK